MYKINIAVLILVLGILSSTAVAQQQRGDIEAQLTGFYFTTIGMDMTLAQGSIQAKAGYYLTDNFEIGAGPTLSITTTTTEDYSFDPNTFAMTTKKSTNTTVDGGTTVFVVYSILSNAKTVPYVGAQFYKQSFKNSDDKGSIGVNAGVKFFFSRRAAFDLGGNYLFSLNSDQSGGILLFSFGLSILF